MRSFKLFFATSNVTPFKYRHPTSPPYTLTVFCFSNIVITIMLIIIIISLSLFASPECLLIKMREREKERGRGRKNSMDSPWGLKIESAQNFHACRG